MYLIKYWNAKGFKFSSNSSIDDEDMKETSMLSPQQEMEMALNLFFYTADDKEKARKLLHQQNNFGLSIFDMCPNKKVRKLLQEAVKNLGDADPLIAEPLLDRKRLNDEEIDIEMEKERESLLSKKSTGNSRGCCSGSGGKKEIKNKKLAASPYFKQKESSSWF